MSVFPHLFARVSEVFADSEAYPRVRGPYRDKDMALWEVIEAVHGQAFPRLTFADSEAHPTVLSALAADFTEG